jgi:hypothetical protein
MYVYVEISHPVFVVLLFFYWEMESLVFYIIYLRVVLVLILIRKRKVLFLHKTSVPYILSYYNIYICKSSEDSSLIFSYLVNYRGST